MTDRPIIFSAPMVRALLDSRKTQTRRITQQPDMDGGERWVKYPSGWVLSVNAEDEYRRRIFYAPGDRLWVREAVCWVSAWGWRYRADNDDLTEKREAGEVGRWRPSIHMPRWASRLTLIVTDVRVQRLQDISEADAIADGCDAALALTMKRKNGGHPGNPVGCYRDLWNSLHGPGAWDANPWVVALTFTVQRGNIDQLPGVAG